MSKNLVISENCCNFKVLKIKSLQTIIAMITEDKVTEIFCIADDLSLIHILYKGFVRSGAMLSAEKMARMKEINSRISKLQQDWGNLLPEATNNAVVWVESKAELAGLSEADIAQCKKDAESRGGKAEYCIVIINTTQQPILASLENRELRRRVYEASIHRARCV